MMPFAGAEVLLESDLLDFRVAALEFKDVLDSASPPLVYSLVVVPNHTQAGAQFMEQPYQPLLDGVDILILINYHVLYSLRYTLLTNLDIPG